MAFPKFEIIDEEPAPQVRPQPMTPDPAFGVLMLALKKLSQRTVIALAQLASLLMVGSVFSLFMSIPNPSQTQIIWGGMYSVFILVSIYLINRVRRE